MKFTLSLKCLTKCAVALTLSKSGLTCSRQTPMLDISRRNIHDITEDVSEGITGNPTHVKEFLDRNNITFQQGFTSLVVGCKQCRHCTHAKAEQSKIFINTTTGGFVCNQCLWSGTWQKFERTVDSFRTGKEEPTKSKKKDDLRSAGLLDALAAAKEEERKTERISSLTEEEFASLVAIYHVTGLEKKILDKFGVRVYENKLDLFFPRYPLDKRKICGYKKLTVKQTEAETVITEQVFPKEVGSTPGLFGWDIINPSATEVVLLADEFEAMIFSQAVKKPVLCLPKGFSVLPVESLPMFEQFGKITLWLNGGSNRAWQTSKIFARKLIESRCFLVSPEIVQKSPLRLFQDKGNLGDVIVLAHRATHKSIVTFASFRQEVFNELNNVGESCGTTWTRFPLLTGMLKGHRKGELTVFTGPTGSGKTTFLSEYSLDLCDQGIRTLWGSFEIRNSRLVKTMLNQFSKVSLAKNVRDFNYWADKFELLPLYFLAFYGQESMDNVLDAMKHAVYVHDIEHIIVDNLQFMMGSRTFGTMNDRFVRQDQMVEDFRRFASTYLCHVTIVMHPRKEMEGQLLSAQSVYGGVKASQEADNVLILQSPREKAGVLHGRKYLEIVKNRFDGELGMMPLYFDKESQSFMRREKTSKKSSHRKSPDDEEGGTSTNEVVSKGILLPAEKISSR